MQQFVFCDAHSLHVCPVSSPPPAVLHGLDLESEHCMFENQNGKVTLVPLGGAQCSVNGVQVTQPSQLNQGETSQTSSATSLQLRHCENVFNNRCLQGRVQCFHFLSVVLRSRCCDSARQDQHVPVQPSEGGGQAEGETKGETLSAES